jgi:hypothetical protein
MTVDYREAEVRALFVAYLVVIVVGLAYFIVLAALHT